MKKIFLLLFLLVFYIPGKAQIKLFEEHTIKTLNDIGMIVVEHYRPQADSVKNNCWVGCVFIRFTFNNKRQFANIDFTATTPIFIKNALAEAFLSINQRAGKINQLRKIDKSVYILPLIVYNRDGCGFMTGWEDANYKPDQETKEMNIRKQEKYDQTINSIFNILNFSSGKSKSVHCILLIAMETGYVMH